MPTLATLVNSWVWYSQQHAIRGDSKHPHQALSLSLIRALFCLSFCALHVLCWAVQDFSHFACFVKKYNLCVFILFLLHQAEFESHTSPQRGKVSTSNIFLTEKKGQFFFVAFNICHRIKTVKTCYKNQVLGILNHCLCPTMLDWGEGV
jgi:hypothetical protein